MDEKNNLKNNYIELSDLLAEDKRRNIRVGCDLPILVDHKDRGQIVNLSKDGFCFSAGRNILGSNNMADLMLSADATLNARYDLVWRSKKDSQNDYIYGARIREISSLDMETLRRYFSDREDLKKRFREIVAEFKNYVMKFKTYCDETDRLRSVANPIKLSKDEYGQACRTFDYYYASLWQIIELYDKKRYEETKLFCQNELNPLIVDQVEINRYIFEKPLGYAGDFMMMNYIYDYYNGNHYLGESTYERFINRYTCSIPISSSNIQRKKYFQGKILDVLSRKKEARMLSVGCGSAREWVELVSGGKITKPVYLTLVDMDERAIQHIKAAFAMIEPGKKEHLHINYMNLNIIALVKNKELYNELYGQDLVYASGLCDYLSPQIAKRLVIQLFGLVREDGRFILCNASEEHMTHRAYYEILGDWKMYHRKKDEMLDLVKLIKPKPHVTFEETGAFKSYYFLNIALNDRH